MPASLEWLFDQLEREKPKPSEVSRFLSFTHCPAGPDPCWEWDGAKTSGGRARINSEYGTFHFRGRSVYSHQFSFLLWSKKAIEQNQHVDHICENTMCVNPYHLRPLCKIMNQNLGRQKQKRNRLLCLRV